MKNAQDNGPGNGMKRAYQKPVLTIYDEIRTITLEGSQFGVNSQFNEPGKVVEDFERGARQGTN